MWLLLIHISETYPRIDPKHHAKPPSGEMHLSHCRALPPFHTFNSKFFPPNVFNGFPGRSLSDSFTILYCYSVVRKVPRFLPSVVGGVFNCNRIASTSLRRPPCQATIRRPDQVSCVHLAPRCRCYGESFGNGGKGATQPPITIKRRI